MVVRVNPQDVFSVVNEKDSTKRKELEDDVTKSFDDAEEILKEKLKGIELKFLYFEPDEEMASRYRNDFVNRIFFKQVFFTITFIFYFDLYVSFLSLKQLIFYILEAHILCFDKL